MIMLTVTKPRRKLKRVLQGLALTLLLAVVVPGIYHSMEAVGAMSMFASGEAAAPEAADKSGAQAGQPEQAALTETEAQPQTEPSTEAKPTAETEAAAEAEQPAPSAEAEPTAEVEPTAETEPTTEAEKTGLWQSLLNVIFGEKPQVTPY